MEQDAVLEALVGISDELEVIRCGMRRQRVRTIKMSAELDALKVSTDNAVSVMGAASAKIDALAAQVAAGGVATAADLVALKDGLDTASAGLQPKTI